MTAPDDLRINKPEQIPTAPLTPVLDPIAPPPCPVCGGCGRDGEWGTVCLACRNYLTGG